MSAVTTKNIGIHLATTNANGNKGDVTASAAQRLGQAIAYFQLDAAYTGQNVTFTTDAVDLGAGGMLSVDIVTANGASYGTLTPVCQTSEDGTTWVAAYIVDSACSTYAKSILGSFEAIGSDTTTSRRLIVDRWVRFVMTIASATVDITISGRLRKN